MHSYEVINHTEITAITTYNHHSYVCAIQKENIFGVEFHPEKSREPGIRIFKNFLKF
jgi:imidazoleglycerol phosphate synthase glutamine amidotransferase subunit HisH